MEEEILTITEKAEMLCDLDYSNHEDFQYKINTELLQCNVMQECYRDRLVSFFQMAPLMRKTVELKDADYIIYANPFARVEDFTQDVLEDLEFINENRKQGSEIIIVGKATNIKNEIDGKYENVTYVDSHYAEYLGKRFGLDIKDKYFVYDERLEQLNIWPVDGCLNKCGFCRRTYMNIPFESLSLEYIKEHLEWFKKYHPEQMEYVSLRAENLTQYGLDIYNKQMLHEVIRLLNNYDEIKYIEIPIGMCIGEVTPEILEAICECKKLVKIALNLEAGSDRLLKLIRKGHTREQAIYVCNAIREAHPNIDMQTTVIVGLPTEELIDMIELSDLIIKCKVNYVHCNYYGFSPKHPIACYPQIDDNVRQLHLSYLIRLLKKNYNGNRILEMQHEKIEDKSKRSVIRENEKLKMAQQYSLPRLLNVVYENFIGHDISIREKEAEGIKDWDDFEKKVKAIVKQKKLTSQRDNNIK